MTREGGRIGIWMEVWVTRNKTDKEDETFLDEDRYGGDVIFREKSEERDGLLW